MAVSTAIFMNDKRAVCLMTQGDTGWVVKDDACTGARMIHRQMNGRGRFVFMTTQAVHGRVIGVHDHHLDGCSGRGNRVDISGRVMAGGAQAVVSG